MIPRPVVTIVVLVLLAILAADVGAQLIPGSTHQASPVIDGAIIALIGAIITGTKGPKPEDSPATETPAPSPALPAAQQGVTGRHHHRSEGPS